MGDPWCCRWSFCDTLYGSVDRLLASAVVFFFFFFVGGRLVTARTRAVRREFLLRSKNGICFGRIDDSQVQSLAWMAIWYKIDAKFNNEHGLLWRSDW